METQKIEWFMWHCSLKWGSQINWEQADKVERGINVLLWKSKSLDKENIGNPKDDLEMQSIQATTKKNVWFISELSEKEKDLFSLRKCSGRSDKKIFSVYFYFGQLKFGNKCLPIYENYQREGKSCLYYKVSGMKIW